MSEQTMEEGAVFLPLAPEYEGATEEQLAVVPENPGDRFAVAYEMTRVAERAYALGRRHQAEIMLRDLHALDKAWSKQIRNLP